MRRLLVTLILLLAGTAALPADTTLNVDLMFSDVSQGAVVAVPFSTLPEGWTQGGLLGTSGLADNSIGFTPVGGGQTGLTIPPQAFLLSNPATITFGWQVPGGAFYVVYRIYADGTQVPRHNTGKFLIKTKSAGIGVRG